VQEIEMATRVNTRFVVILTAVLLVACGGVVGAFAFLLYHTAADLARMGDKQAALGHYKEASDLYSKAVNKEKTNSGFLQKWADALRKQTPETQPRYMDAYGNLGSALRQLAIVSRNNIAAQRAYLDLEKQGLDLSPFKRDGQDSYIREAENLMSQHAGATAEPGADVLRRYRGLARLRVAIESPDAPPEYLDGAKDDLEAALKADPDDAESARALERYYTFKALKADAANNADEATAMFAKGGEVVAAFRASHPQDASMMFLQLRRELDAVARDVSKRQPTDIKEVSDQFRAQALPKLEAATAAAMATPPEKIDRQLINSLRQMELTIDPASQQSRSEALARQALKGSPDDAELIGTIADIQESRENHPEAIATLQQIVDMPNKPVSLDGALLFDRRPDALLRQGLWAFRQWQSLQGGPDKEGPKAKEAADKARDVRAKLAALQDTNSLGVMLLDAQLAFIDGDNRKASRLLEQFNKASNNASPDALMIGAMVAMRLNEPGAARQHLKDLLSIQGTNLRAAFILADLDVRLQYLDEAQSLYEKILKVLPDNTQASEGLKIVTAIKSGKSEKIDDPIVKAVIDADGLAKDTSKADGRDQAAALLRDKIQTLGQDPRLVRELAYVELLRSRKDAALAAVNEGLKAHPENKDLQVMAIQLGGGDALQTRLALIDTQNLPEPQRLAERYLAYKSAGKSDEARAELDKAQKAAPDDRAVFELLFLQAIEDKKFDTAAVMVERAQKDDMDKAGGATYRARLESAQGHDAEAVRIMEEMVKGGGVQPESWRLLGRLQNTVGRRADAVKSFKAALELRPNDVPTIKDLLNTLVVNNQSEDALNTARQYKGFAQNDQEFSNVWLSLEAGFGNRDMVIKERERIRSQNPDDRDNLMALAALYMDTNQRDKARTILDSIRAKQDSVEAMNLDAGWYWAQMQPDKARSIFETYVASIDKADKRARLEALLTYAQFLGQRQDAQGALAVLEQAREVQTPKVSEADKVIGDTYMSMRRYPEAIAAFRRVVDADADAKDLTYRKRMIEAMINGKQYEQADAELAKLLGGAPDAVTLLLASESKSGQKDAAARRQLLDRAVAQFPGDAMVFIKRGQSMLPEDLDEMERLKHSEQPADKAKYQEKLRDTADAKQDFDRALQIDPNLWSALRLRATAYDLLGDADKSVADLRAALLANPGDLDLFRGLVAYLIQNGRDGEAQIVGHEVVDRRPGDAMMRYNVGTIFGQLGKWESAREFLAQAFELDQQDGIAQRYLDCLLSCTPPNLAGAAEVLQKKLTPERIAANPGLLMAQAKMLAKANQPVLATRSAADALKLMKPDSPRDMIAWYNDVQKLEPDPKKLRDVLEGLMGGGVAVDWLKYFHANLLIVDPDTATQQEGDVRLVALLKESKNPPLRQMTYRVLGASLYNQKRFEDAATVMRAALQEFPGDSENMNNLAYLLAKDLGKPAEALPLSESAAKLSPNSAEVLDTLGLVQLMTGKTDESVQTLTKAQPLAQTAFAAATISIHLADALWTQGKKEPARVALASAADIVSKQGAAANPQTKDDLEAVRKKIAGP
jgi:tetratricopeptide (TPR) repeat protein